MDKYDPEVAPDATEWLAIAEQERIKLVEDYHNAAKIEVPNVNAHAAIHVLVENLIAEKQGNVAETIVAQQNNGMTRHEALHAVAKVIATSMVEMMHAKGGLPGQTS